MPGLSRIIASCGLIGALVSTVACGGDQQFSPDLSPSGYGKSQASTAPSFHKAPIPTSPPPAPLPPSTGGRTYFAADAENGTLNAWSLPWGVVQFNGTVRPSQTRARSGSWSYKFEVTKSGQPTQGMVGHDVRTMSGGPQQSMGSPNGRYRSGSYSFWAYIDAGYTTPGWNMLLGWMTGVTGAPSPISHVGLELRNGVLQVVYLLKNCSVGLYTCPTIKGYSQSGGWYTMTPSSPAGIVPFPRNRWVHLTFNYLMAPTNGRLTIWQDGTKIMDLTAPTMNTFGGHSSNLTNKAGDMMLQFGIYGAKADGIQRLYIDDFRVSDLQ